MFILSYLINYIMILWRHLKKRINIPDEHSTISINRISINRILTICKLRLVLHREIFRLQSYDWALTPGGWSLTASCRLFIEKLSPHTWNCRHAGSPAAHHVADKITHPKGRNLSTSGENVLRMWRGCRWACGRGKTIKSNGKIRYLPHRFTPTRTTNWKA